MSSKSGGNNISNLDNIQLKNRSGKKNNLGKISRGWMTELQKGRAAQLNKGRVSRFKTPHEGRSQPKNNDEPPPQEADIKKDASDSKLSQGDRRLLQNVWVSNRMEKSKQLLLISSLALGYLATGNFIFYEIGPAYKLLSVIPILCFVFTIITMLIILDKNPKYIKHLLDHQGQEDKSLKKYLRRLEKVVTYLFGAGIITFCCLLVYYLIFN